MSGTADKAKGHAKEAAGDLIGDEDLEREGKADRASGEAKEKITKAKDWVEDKIDGARDRIG
ncbi:MAG TPA: CsbD family protein [Acidimicrobiales bacterium]|nr:CsbD family protein [Acidimicrobiales bacterium]